jgi:hypothetical protein
MGEFLKNFAGNGVFGVSGWENRLFLLTQTGNKIEFAARTKKSGVLWPIHPSGHPKVKSLHISRVGFWVKALGYGLLNVGTGKTPLPLRPRPI